MSRPTATDYGVFYSNYVELTKPPNNVAELIDLFADKVIQFYTNIPEEMANHKYADDKWTVKQLLQHVIDTERIFGFRALTFSRKDTIQLAGFNENEYAANADAADRSLSDLQSELIHLRKSTDYLLLSFTTEQLKQKGVASNTSITVNALCFIIFGHLLHHKIVLETKYQNTFASSN